MPFLKTLYSESVTAPFCAFAMSQGYINFKIYTQKYS